MSGGANGAGAVLASDGDGKSTSAGSGDGGAGDDGGDGGVATAVVVWDGDGDACDAGVATAVVVWGDGDACDAGVATAVVPLVWVDGDGGANGAGFGIANGIALRFGGPDAAGVAPLNFLVGGSGSGRFGRGLVVVFGPGAVWVPVVDLDQVSGDGANHLKVAPGKQS